MAFSRALARHPLAIIGALLTTASAALFIALVIAVLAGWLVNPYAGLVVFIAIPAAFIVGLLLILGARSPIAIALTALAGSFGVFHVFYHWLKVPLPIGEFGL